jgi:phosphatidate cytidylyltransferase
MISGRVRIGALTMVIVIVVLSLDHWHTRGFLSSAFLAAIAFTASWELCVILESAGLSTYPRITAFASFLVAMAPAVVYQGRLEAYVNPFSIQAGLIFGFLILTFVLAILRDDPCSGAKAVISSTFVLVYVGLALSFLVRLRYIAGIGEAVLFLALAAAKGGDTGAYFVGKRFGRHLMAPRLSPKKTMEGAIGSAAASVLLGWAIWAAAKPPVALWVFLTWALVMNVAGQFGDLSESLLKRAADIKDSSVAFGKMGGILDVVDSLLLSAPVAYILALVAGFGPR